MEPEPVFCFLCLETNYANKCSLPRPAIIYFSRAAGAFVSRERRTKTKPRAESQSKIKWEFQSSGREGGGLQGMKDYSLSHWWNISRMTR